MTKRHTFSYCAVRWNMKNDFECGYINRPYTNLRPFSSVSPCPRFSCPLEKPNFNCGCFPNNSYNYCPPHHSPCGYNKCKPSCDCSLDFFSPHCNLPCECDNSCISKRDLLFFLGGFASGKDRCKP